MTNATADCIMLEQACADFLKGYFSTHQRKEKAQTAYSCDLTQFLAFVGKNLSLPSLSGTIIENWAAHLREEGYAPASARRKMMALKVFCSYWLRKGEIKESPFWRVKLSFGKIQQLPRALTEGEMRALLEQAQSSCSGMEGAHHRYKSKKQNSLCEYRLIRNLALGDLNGALAYV